MWTALFMFRMCVHSLAGSPRPVAVSSLNRNSHGVGGSFDAVVQCRTAQHCKVRFENLSQLLLHLAYDVWWMVEL